MSLLLAPDAPRKRMAVRGLDGLPLSLASDLGKSLPNMRRLARQRPRSWPNSLNSPRVNWTSFYTGEGPEPHGIFHFSHMDPQTYETSMADSSHVR